MGVSTLLCLLLAVAAIFTAAEDECTTAGRGCSGPWRGCTDPNTTRSGDWECTCLPPGVGMAIASVANCTFDECSVNASVCGAGQTCLDPFPYPHMLGDFACKCDGSSEYAVARPASCSLAQDECANNTLCRASGQHCVDLNTSVGGDWECQCPAGSYGTPGRPATCHVDECVVYNATCRVFGQVCHDPNTTKHGDWQCHCLRPYSGVGNGTAAVCHFDECTLHNQTCVSVQQRCEDWNTATLGDWGCSCIPPLKGAAVLSPATCRVDECTIYGATCTAPSQCHDANHTALGDWECRCPTPLQGVAVGGPVTCTLDECNVVGVCQSAGQQCHDPDTAVTDNWECRCTPPATGVAVGKVAVCTLDECLQQSCPANQTCRDPHPFPHVLGDWICSCPLPAVTVGSACHVDECLNNTVCTLPAQCHDPNMTVVGDWSCVCQHPYTGSAVQADVRDCRLDECRTQTTCGVAGQRCVDPDQLVAGDWACECIEGVGKAVGAPATCVVDECVNNTVCSSAGQLCHDPLPHALALNDWVCRCPAGDGTATTAVAVECILNECTANGSTCGSGQTCHDRNISANSLHDWECRCLPPAVGVQTNGSAVCLLDECTITHTCSLHSQRCVDANTSQHSVGDWHCECIAPAVGNSSKTSPAQCLVDECLVNGSVCTAVGQTCRDSDHSTTGNWVCECPPPSQGLRVAAPVAQCTTDECTANGATCSTANQSCHDPNTTATGDWVCRCRPPFTGEMRGGTATCEFDECHPTPAFPGPTAPMANCTSAGQRCVDTDLTTLSTWECHCPPPFTGPPRQHGPTTCTLDECVLYSNSTPCPAPQQRCHDPSHVMRDDWGCNCTVGVGWGRKGPAVCVLDECLGNSVCSAVGQTCFDGNMSTDSRGDWVCRCPNTNVSSTGSVASCDVDECAANGAVCASAGQVCVDPSLGTLADWECRCAAPANGTAGVASPAVGCTLDECRVPPFPCPGQTCRDPYPEPHMRGDWVCACSPPAVGEEVGVTVATTCRLDECSAVTCPPFQRCSDPDHSPAMLNDWKCHCTVGTMNATGGCTLDECALHGGTCRNHGMQECYDPSPFPDRLDDWVCRCVSPATGNATTRRAAACQLDECWNNTCPSGQTCSDPFPYPTRLHDWMCSCLPPSVGMSIATPATCELDECALNTTCHAANQTCVDPHPSPQSTGDWQCMCPSPSEGSAVAKVANCSLDECLLHHHECGAGQSCHDGNAFVRDDWECTCNPPGVGTAITARAACGCPYIHLNPPHGLTPSGAGCVIGGVSANGSTCTFPAGCEPSTCIDGRWVPADPQCHRPCNASQLTSPAAVECTSSQVHPIAHGGTCTTRVPNHSCDVATCVDTKWMPSTIRCKSHACPTRHLVISPKAHLPCPEETSSGTECLPTLAGHRCEAARCEKGSWNTTALACLPLGCPFSRIITDPRVACPGTGMAPNATQCTPVLQGHVCPPIICNLGEWLPAQGHRCLPRACRAPVDVVPQCPVLNGEYPHGTQCNFTSPGRECSDAICHEGAWDPPVTCSLLTPTPLPSPCQCRGGYHGVSPTASWYCASVRDPGGCFPVSSGGESPNHCPPSRVMCRGSGPPTPPQEHQCACDQPSEGEVQCRRGTNCTLPLSDGLCPEGTTRCTPRNAVLLHFTSPPPNVDWSKVSGLVAAMARIPESHVALLSACPTGCPPAGVCPISLNARHAAGCFVPSIDRSVLRVSEGVTVSLDIRDEVARAAATEGIFVSSALLHDGHAGTAPQAALDLLNVGWSGADLEALPAFVTSPPTASPPPVRPPLTSPPAAPPPPHTTPPAPTEAVFFSPSSSLSPALVAVVVVSVLLFAAAALFVAWARRKRSRMGEKLRSLRTDPEGYPREFPHHLAQPDPSNPEPQNPLEPFYKGTDVQPHPASL
eukprot:Sspe_Gene.63654::Locus_36747_Transcript_2_2_Confidence_0.667_Length_6369::g.63654::m.63654